MCRRTHPRPPMPSWILKAALQRAIGVLPNAHAVNEWFQKRTGTSLDLDDKMADKLAEARGHLDRYARHGRQPLGTAVEIGTGWYPVLSLALVATGAERVITYDVARYLTPDRVRKALAAFVEWAERGDLDAALPNVDPDRVRQFARLAEKSEATADELLAPLGIEYRVADATASGLESGSVDLVVSTVVLEYVPRGPLVALLAETNRIGAPGAVHSHEVDLTDQYHYFDPSITPFHFLRFSDAAWRWISNPLIPLTRLRASDYRRAFEQAGLELAEETLDRGDPAALAATPLSDRFRSYDADDLLVTRAWFTARTPAPLAEPFRQRDAPMAVAG